MRGYFGVGVERISKAMNLGAVLRTAHAFGASFAFSIDAAHPARDIARSDTSASAGHLPYYAWPTLEEMSLPDGCALIGVELTEDAIDLPSFRHPPAAAYLLGPEKGDLSTEALARCAHVVKIPTKFCINVSLAAALVCYDRVLSHGGHPPRPLSAAGVRARLSKPDSVSVPAKPVPRPPTC